MEYELDEEFDSVFKTKIRWDHVAEREAKPQKFKNDIQDAMAFKTLEAHANTRLMNASKK